MFPEMLTFVAGALTTHLQGTVDARCQVILGRPVFFRPEVVPPIVGIHLSMILDPEPRRAIGRVVTGYRPVWMISIFGRDELEKDKMVEEVMAWIVANAVVTNDTHRYVLELRDRKEHDILTTNINEAYGFEIDVFITEMV